MKLDSRRRLSRSSTLAALGIVFALGLASCGGGDDSSSSSTDTKKTPLPPPQASVPYSLSADGEVLIGPKGQRIPIQPGTVEGYVDHTKVEDDVIALTGWAAPIDLSGGAKQVVVVVGDAGVAATKPSLQRADVAEAYSNPALGKTGFQVSVGTKSLQCSEPAAGLVFYAVAKGVAGPLSWVEGIDEQVESEAC